MAYVDGFVAAVPTANCDLYKKHAEAAAVVFKEHGATKLVECWGDDVPDGKLTSFPMAAQWVNLNMQLLRLLVARMAAGVTSWTRIVQLSGTILASNRDGA